MSKERLASLIVASIYLAAALITEGVEGFVHTLIFLVFCLACIWFGDEMGSFLGFAGIGRPRITKKTPGIIMRLGGWILLFSPPFVALVVWMVNRE